MDISDTSECKNDTGHSSSVFTEKTKRTFN